MYNNGIIGNIPTPIHYMKILSISHFLFIFIRGEEHILYHMDLNIRYDQGVKIYEYEPFEKVKRRAVRLAQTLVVV